MGPMQPSFQARVWAGPTPAKSKGRKTRRSSPCLADTTFNFKERDQNDSGCMAMKLVTHNLPNMQDGDITTINPASFCSSCAHCRLLAKVRGCTALPEDKHDKVLQFWAHLNVYANSLGWTAIQGDNYSADDDYPVIKYFCKDAILDHYRMCEFGSNIQSSNFETRTGISLAKSNRAVNAIQLEELCLTDALIYWASHYSALSYDSNAISKLEALNVAKSILKTLRMLWTAELQCRRAAYKDVPDSI